MGLLLLLQEIFPFAITNAYFQLKLFLTAKVVEVYFKHLIMSEAVEQIKLLAGGYLFRSMGEHPRAASMINTGIPTLREISGEKADIVHC